MYPSLNQFLRWASQYKAVPVWLEPEIPPGDLLPWIHTLLGGQDRFFLLHSASATPQTRYSYFSLERPRCTIRTQDRSLTLRYLSDEASHLSGRQAGLEVVKVGNPLDRFHDWLARWKAPTVDALPPFWGGAVGYLGYDSARYLEPKLSFLDAPRLARPPVIQFPDFEFGLFDAVGAIDHARQRLWLIHTVLLPERASQSPAQLEKMYRLAQDQLRRHAVRLQKAVRQQRTWGSFQVTDLHSNCSEAAYQLMVRRAKGYIASGDMYQCNLSQRFSAQWRGDPWTLYRHLTDINPSPYAALWRSEKQWVVSASPELLLRKEADAVETRPIAGTYPRGKNAKEDQVILQALQRDVKERAEHIMMVDLERNDLSRVCLSPTVQAAEALVVEAYSHVFHLVSDIRGRLAPGTRWADVVRAVFPGGTITGCPKLRCMQLIHKLEQESRGPYCGSLGWIGFNGDLTLNILIRTLFIDDHQLCFPVGAGIVADSIPAREYQETLHKAEALLLALQGQDIPQPPEIKRQP